VVQGQKNLPVTVGIRAVDSGVIMSSPDLRSEVVGAMDLKDAPKPRREKF